MRERSRLPAVYVVCLLGAAVLLALLGRDSDVRAGTDFAHARNDTIPNIEGEWSGAWNDTVYGETGDMSWVIQQDGSDFTASGVIDMSFMGMGDIAGTAEGSIARVDGRATLSFTFLAAGLGNGSGSVIGGSGSGSGAITAPLNWGPFTFQGTVTDEAVSGTFDFTDPGGGAGTGILTKDTPVEDTTWGAVKSRYRADE